MKALSGVTPNTKLDINHLLCRNIKRYGTQASISLKQKYVVDRVEKDMSKDYLWNITLSAIDKLTLWPRNITSCRVF